MRDAEWPFVVHDNTGMYVNQYKTRAEAYRDIARIELNQMPYTEHVFTTPFTITFDPKGHTA